MGEILGVKLGKIRIPTEQDVYKFVSVWIGLFVLIGLFMCMLLLPYFMGVMITSEKCCPAEPIVTVVDGVWFVVILLASSLFMTPKFID